MDTPPPARPGFIAALGRLGESLLGAVQTRIELFSTELQEEKFRLVQTLSWICALVFSAGLALAFASLVLVYFYWESARLAVLGGLALFYSGSFLALLLAFRRFLARQPVPFAATLGELEADRVCILKRS
jgi:uncharacterized membrane protein YqjE